VGELKRHKSIADALQYVAEHPIGSTAAPIDAPVYELVCQALFQVANSPDSNVRGSFAKANRAQKLILNRMVGRRRPGTHPAQARTEEIEFVDLTAGVGEVAS
jgi:hypothetical protein